MKPAKQLRHAALRWVCLALLLAGMPVLPPIQAQPSREVMAVRRIEAGFVYNFIRFTTWPNNQAEDAPIRIVVVGDALSAELMIRELDGKICGKHKLSVRHLPAGEPLTGLEVLFVMKRSESDVGELLRKLGKSPVLTIGESETFLAEGGMIRLYERKDSIRFTLNLKAAREAGITLSSQLADLASPEPK